MDLKWAKSNSKFCQIFSTFDIMNIVSIVAFSDGISMKYFMEFVVG